MKIAPVADVKARLSAYLEQCQTEGPVIITRNGKAVAVLLAPDDDADLERLVLARSPHFRALLERSRRSIVADRGLPRDEFWKALQQRVRRRSVAAPRE